jgi:hypothetical protein
VLFKSLSHGLGIYKQLHFSSMVALENAPAVSAHHVGVQHRNIIAKEFCGFLAMGYQGLFGRQFEFEAITHMCSDVCLDVLAVCL